jgi:hypothetical protein
LLLLLLDIYSDILGEPIEYNRYNMLMMCQLLSSDTLPDTCPCLPSAMPTKAHAQYAQYAHAHSDRHLPMPAHYANLTANDSPAKTNRIKKKGNSCPNLPPTNYDSGTDRY